MGQLVDCRAEFTIRHQLNRMERAIKELNLQHRVIVYMQQDQDKPLGVGYVLYDKYSKNKIMLDKPEYYS